MRQSFSTNSGIQRTDRPGGQVDCRVGQFRERLLQEELYHFFAKYFGTLTFALTMSVGWILAALAMLLPGSTRFGFIARRGGRWRTRFSFVVGAYLAIGVLVAPGYFGSSTNFLWNPPNMLHNLFGAGGLSNVLFWPSIAVACAEGC